MIIKTNYENRKALVQEIAALIQEPARYLGAPSFAYQVGAYTIDRGAAIYGDDLEALRGLLLQHGFITEDTVLGAPAPDADKPKDTETMNVIHEREVYTETDGNSCVTAVNLKFHAGVSAGALINFLRLLYARQDLIAAMTGGDALKLDDEILVLLDDLKADCAAAAVEIMLKSETRLGMVSGVSIEVGCPATVALRFKSNTPGCAEAPLDVWADFADLIWQRAARAKRVSTKRVTPTDEGLKYDCRVWLLQLGMIGEKYKAHRQVLLRHLQGAASFKSECQLEAHKEKRRQRRRESAVDLEAAAAGSV